MLKIVKDFGMQPHQWIVDPSAEFQPGMIAEIKPLGNQIVCGVSSGLRPIGIIDDIKTNAFSSMAIDEVHNIFVPLKEKNSDNLWINGYDIVYTLDNPHLTPKSFSSNLQVALNPKNGVVTIPAGTILNSDQDGDGIPDSFYLRVSYSYQIPNQPGDDTTASSKRVTVWVTRLIAQTDQYDPGTFPLTHPLFVNERGLLTTRRITANHPPVAVVLAPPTHNSPYLEFMWM